MRISLFLSLLFVLFGCSRSHIPIILSEDYTFLSTDSELIKLKQSNDTLYEYECYINRPCLVRPVASYKIMSSQKNGEFIILKIKGLHKADPGFPENKYSLLIFKNIDKKQLGYSYPRYNLTLRQLDSIQINIPLNQIHYSTYYSDSYLKDLATLKKVSTKDQVKEITEALRDKMSRLVTYSAEELTKVCIEKGYNPVGAGFAIDSMMK